MDQTFQTAHGAVLISCTDFIRILLFDQTSVCIVAVPDFLLSVFQTDQAGQIVVLEGYALPVRIDSLSAFSQNTPLTGDFSPHGIRDLFRMTGSVRFDPGSPQPVVDPDQLTQAVIGEFRGSSVCISDPAEISRRIPCVAGGISVCICLCDHPPGPVVPVLFLHAQRIDHGLRFSGQSEEVSSDAFEDRCISPDVGLTHQLSGCIILIFMNVSGCIRHTGDLIVFIPGEAIYVPVHRNHIVFIFFIQKKI